MSDTESDFSDISILNEIGELIDSCEVLHERIQNSYDTLQNIHTLVKNSTNIMVENNVILKDFDEVLDTCHNNMMNKIKEGIACDFSDELLAMIHHYTFSM